MAYTTIDDPSVHFQAETYTGAGANTAVTFSGNSNLQPDLLWIKNRGAGYAHFLVDSSRNISYAQNSTNAPYLEPDSTALENNNQNWMQSVNTDGFTTGISEHINSTASSTFVAWAWKLNGGTTSSNTDGNLTSTLQVNSTAGMSIGTYTGINGYKTVGHGLGAIPDLVMVKGRDMSGTAQYWVVGAPNHPNFGNNSSKHVFLDSTSSLMNNTTVWYNTAFTTTTIPIGPHASLNNTGSKYVFYAFKNVKGFSKIGHYIGNGSNDGPFVYTGFKPRWVLIKNLDATQVWIMYDGARKPVNRDDNVAAIYASETSAEYTGASYHNLDILSNGFKIRLTDASQNGNGVDYLYMAFAENPFVTSTGIPTTAR